VAVGKVLRELPDYASKLERIASLRPAVDLFFDKVMVNVDNPPFAKIGSHCSIACSPNFHHRGFSEIVTTSQENK